jgi:hypothetical protein
MVNNVIEKDLGVNLILYPKKMLEKPVPFTLSMKNIQIR